MLHAICFPHVLPQYFLWFVLNFLLCKFFPLCSWSHISLSYFMNFLACLSWSLLIGSFLLVIMHLMYKCVCVYICTTIDGIYFLSLKFCFYCVMVVFVVDIFYMLCNGSSFFMLTCSVSTLDSLVCFEMFTLLFSFLSCFSSLLLLSWFLLMDIYIYFFVLFSLIELLPSCIIKALYC